MAEFLIGNVLGPQGEPGAKGADGTTVAVKLGSTQYNHTGGVINLPAYPTSLPASGGNATTANGHTVDSDVPLNAKFTDTVYSHPTSHPASMITGLPTKLSQLIDDIGASGGEQGALIFDALAAQQGVKLKEYKVGENYISDIRLSSNNLLLASKTEPRSGTSYITVIKVYADNGTTVKQTITITEKKTSDGYETIVT